MAASTFGELRLNLVSDPEQRYSFPLLSALSSAPTKQVASQSNADGSVAAVRAPGRVSGVSCAVSAGTSVDRQALEVDLLGELVWVRDDRSRKFAGYYTAPQISEHQFDVECEISLTFTEVTVSELN